MATRKMMGGGFFKKATGNERGWRNWAKAVFSGHASQLNSQEMKNAIRDRRMRKAINRAQGTRSQRKMSEAVAADMQMAAATRRRQATAARGRSAAEKLIQYGPAERWSNYNRLPSPPRAAPPPVPNLLGVAASAAATTAARAAQTASRAALTASRAAASLTTPGFGMRPPPGSRQLASAARAAASMAYAPYQAQAPGSRSAFNRAYNNIYKNIRAGVEQNAAAKANKNRRTRRRAHTAARGAAALRRYGRHNNNA